MTKRTEIIPGLSMRVLKEGKGDGAVTNQHPVMHYTGWLYDETADNNRGAKFDSSLDHGKYFHFTLGQGRVIKGWEHGILGMKIGEIRELAIASDLAYGPRGNAGIPPNSTLVFEIELFAFVNK